MIRTLPIALSSLLSLALSAGVAPSQTFDLPAATPQAMSFEDCKKIYGHLTLNQVGGWFKKMPSTPEEAKKQQQEFIQIFKHFEAAQSHFAEKHPGKGKEEMSRCFAGLNRYYSEDFPLFADMNGTYGVMLSQAGDVAGADEAFRKQRVCIENLFPIRDFPNGSPRLAIALTTIGSGQFSLGRKSEGEKLFRQALEMYRKVGPAHPSGSDLTTLIIQLSVALAARKEYGEAETLAREALKRCELHCSTPEGRVQFITLLAKVKNNLGAILQAIGKPTEAEKLLSEAASIDRNFSGQAQQAVTLSNRAVLALSRGEYSEALALSEESIRAVEAAYPPSEYPQGHPYMVHVLLARGETLAASGDRDAAERLYTRCYEMVRSIYTDERCPEGHPDLATVLLGIGSLHLRRPDSKEEQSLAVKSFRDSLRVSLGHTRIQASYLSEPAMLKQLDSAGSSIDGLLSATTPFDSRDYWFLWETKAAVMRVMDHRRCTALASTDPSIRELDQQLQETREALAEQTFGSDFPRSEGTALAALTRRKEELEARMAEWLHLPLPPRGVIGPMALSQALPPNAAFVDFWIYLKIEQDPRNSGNEGRTATPHYAAFVMTRNGQPTRVELGSAREINRAVDEWLALISRNPPDPESERHAASTVRDLVWKKLDGFLRGASTLYVCPDGVFGRVPFGALPNAAGDKVVLEDMKIVEVPHGPGLVSYLRTPPGTARGPVLAIGSVDYGAGTRLRPLPATEKELNALKKLAADSRTETVLALSRGDATPRRVSAELSKARIAHFATHGEALDVKSESDDAFSRNRLLGCRLALSGANAGAIGELSGEAIAGLRLNDLDLTVLSACKTAIGHVELREGVFALRRAFHTAGCRAVVASLWSVEDNSTAALMTRFYYHLWIDRHQPDDALREAQLDLYRSPRSIAEWADGRGGAVPLPMAPIVMRESLPRKWAGFRLSINQP